MHIRYSISKFIFFKGTCLFQRADIRAKLRNHIVQLEHASVMEEDVQGFYPCSNSFSPRVNRPPPPHHTHLPASRRNNRDKLAELSKHG